MKYRRSSGALSRAEGCCTFDARDRMPRPSRANAHHLVETPLTVSYAPPPARAGSFFGAFQPIMSGASFGGSCAHSGRSPLVGGMMIAQAGEEVLQLVTLRGGRPNARP